MTPAERILDNIARNARNGVGLRESVAQVTRNHPTPKNAEKRGFDMRVVRTLADIAREDSAYADEIDERARQAAKRAQVERKATRQAKRRLRGVV